MDFIGVIKLKAMLEVTCAERVEPVFYRGYYGTVVVLCLNPVVIILFVAMLL